MLELKQIVKDYQAGDTAVHALKGVTRLVCSQAMLSHPQCG